jgi:hypothetical protein
MNTNYGLRFGQINVLSERAYEEFKSENKGLKGRLSDKARQYLVEKTGDSGIKTQLPIKLTDGRAAVLSDTDTPDLENYLADWRFEVTSRMPVILRYSRSALESLMTRTFEPQLKKAEESGQKINLVE